MIEFRIDDLIIKNKQMNKFFKNAISKPQNLLPMLENIKKEFL
mgnify:FL=1